jgi:hypothetical protein
MKTTTLALALFSLAATSLWSAPLNYNDTLLADLSGNGSAPTTLIFDVGVNTVGGRMGRDEPSDPVDADIFTFTLAADQVLTSINVLSFGPANASFYAIAAGPSISTSSSTSHLSNKLINTTGEILGDLAAGSYSGGTGLTAPIGPGTYTVWFQEVSSLVDYNIAYTVAAIPEPSTYAAIVGALSLGFGVWRRRRAGGFES